MSDRLIRIFVSSTFQDMQDEREELVKHVFPHLRKRCEERGVAWSEVDLRWGIPDEEAAEGRVLPVCLAEIRRCNVFVGILGERHGWVPDELPDEAAGMISSLGDPSGRSVTEIEIRSALELGIPAFFYLRASAGSRPERGRGRRLAALKALIRRSAWPVREGYAGARSLGALVRDDLEALIDERFPGAEPPDLLAREAEAHAAFSASLTRVFVGRSACLDALDAHADGRSPPLVVAGEAGSGKSALVSRWLARRRGNPGEVRLAHHVGASVQSTDWAAMLRRLVAELRGIGGVDDPVPDDPDALREAFGPALACAAVRRRVILVLDGVDRLDDREGALDLVWLPVTLPDRIRLVLTLSPGRSLARCERLGWPRMLLGPLAETERMEFIRAQLLRYGKRLAPEHVGRIASRPQAANARYLKALVEELRVHGKHETLGATIDRYLAAGDPSGLYELVLARWEADYERERPNLVRDALRLLWAARHGLSEPELLELLGGRKSRLPAARWSPFRLACEDALIIRAGKLALAPGDFRDAAERRYLEPAAARRRAHLRLADHFAARGVEPRALEEVPWQLAEARAWDRLARQLCSPGFLRAAWERDEFDLMRTWTRMADRGNLLEVASTALAASGDAGDLWALAGLAAGTADAGGARLLWRQLIERHRDELDPVNLQAALGNLALLEVDRGALREALALLGEQEALCRTAGHLAGLRASLGYQAVIRQTEGNAAEALRLLLEQERLCREAGDRRGLQGCLGNQGLVRHHQGDFRTALALFGEQERLCRESDQVDGLLASQSNRALTLHAVGDLAGAEALLGEVAEACAEIGDPAGRIAALNNRALVLRLQGDTRRALALLEEVETLCGRMENADGRRAALGQRAVILQAEGDFPGALELHREEERLCRQIGHGEGLQTSLGNQAHAHLALGDLETAARLADEQAGICREIGSMPGLQAALDTRGQILNAAGEFDSALAVLGEAERMARDLGHEEALQEALSHRARAVIGRGGYAAAIGLLAEAEGICRASGLAEGQARVLWLQGLALRGLGQDREAARKIGDALGLARSCGLEALARAIERS